MKRVLILGALAGQVDAVESLKMLGAEVHVCAHERSGPGVEAADYFHLVDITDKQAVEELAVSLGADLVYSVGSDIAMPTVTAVSERLGLPHFHGSELTDVLRRKQELRRVLDAGGVPTVLYCAVPEGASAPTWDHFPCIVKPVDAQGQRGITIVEHPQFLEAAIRVAQSAALSGAAIVEELLRGPEVSAHALVVDGKLRFFLPSDRHTWDGPMVGVPRAHSVPLRSETLVHEPAFRELAHSSVEALGVANGPLYFQAILTEDGPRIIEIASRLDGCHLWRLIETATSFDLLTAIFHRLLSGGWQEIPDEVSVSAHTLEFFLESPEVDITPGYLAGLGAPDATFVEQQLDSNGDARRTNSVVSRIGYEIYPGLPR